MPYRLGSLSKESFLGKSNTQSGTENKIMNNENDTKNKSGAEFTPPPPVEAF